ncbi:FHA domain-containing protein [Mycobacterium vicinigordonae]|uniref:FHA domain-containing protein n=1 Tax=Mycobacterium vicinigordonae TaxID=1719132 RepID=A0A7D6DUS9_9MYCO|nr:FHA domain-containing protein [Mycobacterium vicinigordonae]
MAPLDAADEVPSGTGILVVKRGPNAGSRFLLNQPATSAGSHPASDIYLDDETVSRHHAEFHCDGTEFRLVDVGSLNGTYVNGELVQTTQLHNGDEVEIGRFRLMFLLARSSRT